MSAFLSVAKVSRVFGAINGRAAFHALDRVSFEVREKEFVSLLGPSGCGKSTLLTIIGGFDQPSGGDVFLRGEPVRGPSRDRGFVFQSDALFHWLTVEDNVGYGLKVQGYSSARRHEIVERYLQLVGLTKFRQATPGQLSGGMRQRAAIARSLATDPSILLLDEPFGALDVLTRKTMQDELARIWEETQKTIVMVTHSIEESVLLSDRIVVMTRSPGRIREEIAVDLPRPRSSRDPALRALELHITDMIMQEMLEANAC